MNNIIFNPMHGLVLLAIFIASSGTAKAARQIPVPLLLQLEDGFGVVGASVVHGQRTLTALDL